MTFYHTCAAVGPLRPEQAIILLDHLAGLPGTAPQVGVRRLNGGQIVLFLDERIASAYTALALRNWRPLDAGASPVSLVSIAEARKALAHALNEPQERVREVAA
jgi:hypothetical protein